MDIKNKTWSLGGLLLGLLLGILLRSCVSCGGTAANGTDDDSEGDAVWTCSMDPQVKQPHPGKCPKCGMDLIKMEKGMTPASDIDPDAVMMSDEAMALANVETEIVGTPSGNKEIRLFGKVEPDQRQQQSQSAYVAGRIERLFINAVGDHVAKGQTLAVIYSPELYTAGQELVSALGTSQQVLVDAARHVADAAAQDGVLVVGHALHEVAVVAHEDERAGPGVEQVLEHGEHVGVEVVAGLVEHEHVGLLHEDAQDRQATSLAA